MPVQRGKLKPADEAKIRANFEYIIDQVEAKDLTNGLCAREVFDDNDIEEIENQPSKKKRARKMLDFLLNAGPGEAFENFMLVLGVAYEHVAERIRATPSRVQQQSSWTWFDELSDDFKSTTIKDGDLSRISSLIANRWETLVLQLGLSSVNISQERTKHPYDLTLVLTNLLIRWRMSRASRDATLLSFVSVLREVDCELDMEGLKRVILNMSSSQTQARPLETHV